MPRFACVDASNNFVHPERFRVYAEKPADVPQKGWRWLPADPVTAPAFDPASQVREGPTYVVGASAVTESWSVRSKTVPEIDADKDAAIGGLNGSTYTVLMKVLLSLENDNRAIKMKINDLLTELGAAATTTTKYPAGQVAQITMAQLKTAIKAML
jgi:hypothetical protein